MVSKKSDGCVYFKLTYWGPSQGGKTTSVDALYSLLREKQSYITPVSDFQKIAMHNQSTLFFDRGVFKSGGRVFFQVYTVAGQKRFVALRKVVFTGTDGVIFVADSEKSQWEENVEALEELVALTERSGKKLIEDYPLIVMLNKRDLPTKIERNQIYDLLKQYELLYPPTHEFSLWNPLIYETVAIRGVKVVRAFAECARRIVLYHSRGGGKAPA